MDNENDYQRRFEDKLSVRERLIVLETTTAQQVQLVNEVREQVRYGTRLLIGILLATCGSLVTSLIAIFIRH